MEIHGHVNRGMAHPLLDVDRTLPLLEQERRTRVAEIVEADAPEFGLLE